MTAIRHRWPRTMKKATAAEYVECPIREFERMVAAGDMPPPFLLAGKEAWDIAELDAAIDEIKSSVRRRRGREGQPARV